MAHLLKLELKKFRITRNVVFTFVAILFSILFMTVSLVDSMTDPEQTKDTFESMFTVVGLLMSFIFLVYSSVLTARLVIGEYNQGTITIMFSYPLNRKHLIASKLIIIMAYTAISMVVSSINWNNFNITANDEVYQNISSALSDTGTLITTLIIVITAVSMVLIILILSMSIRSRKRETGILLAVGIAKPAVILQYVLETLLIAVVAFPLAYLSSKQVAGTLGTLFGKAAENVIVTTEHFLLVAIVGGILLVAAVLVSSISTLRLKPKQILAQME